MIAPDAQPKDRDGESVTAVIGIAAEHARDDLIVVLYPFVNVRALQRAIVVGGFPLPCCAAMLFESLATASSRAFQENLLPESGIEHN